MDNISKKADKSRLATGGRLLIGLGVSFIFLEVSGVSLVGVLGNGDHNDSNIKLP